MEWERRKLQSFTVIEEKKRVRMRGSIEITKFKLVTKNWAAFHYLYKSALLFLVKKRGCDELFRTQRVALADEGGLTHCKFPQYALERSISTQNFRLK